MTDYFISDMIGPGGDTWNLPSGEHRRQAIASLRGYAYQLHRTVSEWLALGPRDFLFVEAAEDYARIGRHPDQIEESLAATQVKDTRQSGAVTLNSEDALAAVVNFWRLKLANPGRQVALAFLTTSPIGVERKDPLASGLAGLAAWQSVARGEVAQVDHLRTALLSRLVEPTSLVRFVETADDEAFVSELIRPITWSCGEPDYADIVQQNREDVVALGVGLQGSAEQSRRALDTLLHTVLDTIVTDETRRLTRGRLVEIIEQANTVRVPIAKAMASGMDLEATGSWVPGEMLLPAHLAGRPTAMSQLDQSFDQRRRLWLHGANGMGKSTLAALFGQHRGGRWQTLRLRGMSGAAASERLIAARQALGRVDGLIGLTIDDLPVPQESHYLVALQAIGATLSREGLACVVTANQQPGNMLQQALGLTSQDIVEAPEFSDDDAARLVVAYDGNAATWAKFVRYAGGFGHPQLVHAVVAGVASRGWRTEELTSWFKDGFLSDDVNKERATVRRRLLDELEPDRASLLSRLSRVKGSFDRRIVDDLAALDPKATNARAATEMLTGTWVERLGDDRLRISPLIADLADHLAATEQIIEMDRTIAHSIILRPSLDVDLLDTGFLHAMLAQDDAAIVRLCFAIMNGEHGAALASAMPMFREFQANLSDAFYRPGPMIALLLALARHRLLVTRREREEINESVRYALGLVDGVGDGQSQDGVSTLMALTTILGAEESMGLVDDWFLFLRQLDQSAEGVEKFGDIYENASNAMGIPPNDFLFVAHTVQLPDIEALQSLFEQLSALPQEERARWLSALKREAGWPSLAIANAWLKEVDSNKLDWAKGADRYAALAQAALSWGETHLAARCIVAQSVLIDEYGNDAMAALDVLNSAEAALPRNLDLVRERAKIAWRMGDYERAFEGLSSIEDWLQEGDAIEAAFAFREAAMSAGELERYVEAERYFRMAHDAASKVKTDQEAFKLGLMLDAAAVRWMSGDRRGAVRNLVPVLERLKLIDPNKNLQSRAVVLLGRHFVLWLRSQRDAGIKVDDRPVHYFIGAISNPSPHLGLLEMPTPKSQAPLWFLFGLVALDEGIAFDELSNWLGIVDLKRYADIYSQLPIRRLELAVAEGNPGEFQASLSEAMAGVAHIRQSLLEGLDLDPLDPREIGLGETGTTEAGASAAQDLMRDAAIAYALNAVLRTGNADFEAIGGAVNIGFGMDLVPQWSSRTATDTRGAAAVAVLDLAEARARSLTEDFQTQLRLWDWLQLTVFKTSCMPELSAYARDFWHLALRTRRFELSAPNVVAPDIEKALGEYQPTNRWLGRLLLVAGRATLVRLSADFVDGLENAK